MIFQAERGQEGRNAKFWEEEDSNPLGRDTNLRLHGRDRRLDAATNITIGAVHVSIDSISSSWPVGTGWFSRLGFLVINQASGLKSFLRDVSKLNALGNQIFERSSIVADRTGHRSGHTSRGEKTSRETRQTAPPGGRNGVAQ